MDEYGKKSDDRCDAPAEWAGDAVCASGSEARRATFRVGSATLPERLENKGKVTEMLRGRLRERLGENASLSYVVRFFDKFVADLGLENAGFFEQAGMVDDFNMRLEKFIEYVDKRIAEVGEILKGNEDYSKFSVNWENNVKKACYYSFFVHYGEKRMGEKEADGTPRDYVYHPVRTGFDCLIKKMRFFDETTLLASFLHDTGEDYEKGFVGLLHVKNQAFDDHFKRKRETAPFFKIGTKPRRKVMEKGELILPSFRTFEDHLFQETGGVENENENEATISGLLDLLTKTLKNRSQSLLEMFVKIENEENDAKRFSLRRALLIKMADRLDNLQTFRGGGSVKDVEGETVFIFLKIAKYLGMTNVADFFYDYLYFGDIEKTRRIREARRQPTEAGAADEPGAPEAALPPKKSIQEIQRLRGLVVQDLERKLTDAMNDGHEYKAGEDFIIEFRDKGYRYEDVREVMKLAEKGKYARAFRSYIIFHPTESNSVLADTARRAFGGIFSGELHGNNLKRPEFNTSLGKTVLEYGGAGYHKGGEGEDSYGAGVWCVFDSPQEGMKVMNGKFHAAYFCNDRGADAEIAKMFRDYKDNMNHLVRQYGLLELFKAGLDYRGNVEDVETQVRARISGLVCRFGEPGEGDDRRYCGVSGAFAIGKGITVDKNALEVFCKKFEELLNKLVLLLFFRQFRATGVYINKRFCNVSIPEDVNGWIALLFANPVLLGREVKGFTLLHSNPAGDVILALLRNFMQKSLKFLEEDSPVFWAMDKPIQRDVTLVNFEIDENVGFDPGLASLQLKFLDKILRAAKQHVLFADEWGAREVGHDLQAG